MKFILYFIIGLLNISKIITRIYNSIGQLTKHNIISVSNNNGGCVYLNKSEFGNSGNISIKVTTYNSSFKEEIIYYDEYDTNVIGVTFNLNNILHYSSFNASSSFNYDSYTFYYEFSYYFDIPISSSSGKYIYISILDFLCYSYNCKTEIGIENDTKRNSTDKVIPESGNNNTGEIVGIIIAVIALIFFVIMIFICYRRKKEGEYASKEEHNSTEIPLSVFYPRVV